MGVKVKALTIRQFNEKIRPLGFEAEAKNNGYHFLIRCREFVVSYYPTTNKWVGENNHVGYDLESFLDYLRSIRHQSLMFTLPKREFICKRVFMATFRDPLNLMPLYGVSCFAQWYDYAMQSPTDAWMTAKDGTRLVVLPEWCGAPAKDVMRQVYFDIEDIVRAIRTENVEI